MSDPQAGLLNYTRTDSVAIPQSAAEMRFAIRKSDWERLKRNLLRCKSDISPNLSGWYFCCFGISGSAAVSMVPLVYATGLAGWVVPTYGCVTVAAGMVGIVLMKIDRRFGHERKDRLDEVGIDMKDIEDGFGSTT